MDEETRVKIYEFSITDHKDIYSILIFILNNSINENNRDGINKLCNHFFKEINLNLKQRLIYIYLDLLYKNKYDEVFEIKESNEQHYMITKLQIDEKTNLFLDKFMTMNYVQNKEHFNIRYQTKPLMIWIWISVIFISLGGLTSLYKKKHES